ncbi:MAG: DUF3667 domain-containing protein [Verrucomicrobiota bacterium]|nr:DUF3667 domain-containing protein [Verrucomicrobiota bacterium]
MADESTQLILGDAAVDAMEEGRRGRRQRKRPRHEQPLTHCENCQAPLTGQYCAQCGQHAIDYRRSLWAVLIDAADSFFNWDTKFLSSLWVLLVRPWRLTNDFNAGRRARYVHPLRLYLLGSIAFFLIVKVVNIQPDQVIRFDPGDRQELVAALGKLVGTDPALTPEERTKVEDARQRLALANGVLGGREKVEIQSIVTTALRSNMKDKFERAERARIRKALAKVPKGPTAPEVPADTNPAATAPSAEPVPLSPAAPILPLTSAAPAAPERQPSILFKSDDGKKPTDPLGAWIEARVKAKVGEGGTKAKLFLETLRNNIPTMMLCCIPLFALVLKVLYLRKRRYYVEHLVYALHIHTFAYVGVTVITLIGMGVAHFSETGRFLVATALSFAMAAQIFLSIRRVYGQGWIITALKFLLGGFVYFVILICAVGVTAFITLLLPD